MNQSIKSPKAFISCSLRAEDKAFIDWIVRLTKLFGFSPFGTIGKYSAAPKPLYQQMKEGIEEADCLILIATPRYVQEDLHTKVNTGHGISEMLHVEVGMAVASGKPVLVFVQKGTNVGTFVPNLVQYIEIDVYNQEDIQKKWPLIVNYFRSALSIITSNWEKAKNKETMKMLQGILAVIGGAAILNSIFTNDQDDDYDYYEDD
ncbi:hypothetical protein EHQ61_00775 [Leptospira wolffii]|uniref:toll/interleukin-1 receptor domain-containing protein n=1 Tax=Leptospira wolffii TaxID=409998 RepID=UPI0010823615|nr:toll/interleukin-1 receptor domain-containing protein [Leptospira wolffii]TGL55276.1 hypothetical protein EHQ61_00775 [Leptospira wolffii]